jgi:hypothetical protein
MAANLELANSRMLVASKIVNSDNSCFEELDMMVGARKGSVRKAKSQGYI